MILRWSYLLLAVSALLATSSSTIAAGLEENNYFGIGASSIKHDDDIVSVTTHNTALTIKVGHDMNEFFAMEGRVAFGLGEDKIEDFAGSIDVNFELDYLIGMYFRGNLPIGGTPRVRAYALLGFTQAKFTARAEGFSDSDTETDIGYGLGIELFGNERNAISLEYLRALDIEDDGDFTVDSVSIAYINRF